MTEETYSVGNSNIAYDVLCNNRQERKRKTTDVAPLVIYVMFIVVWVGIAIYAYSYSGVPPLEVVGREMQILREYLFFSPAILFFIWFCILLIVFYFIMLRWCTKFTVYFTIFLECLLITLICLRVAFFQPAIGIPILIFCYLIVWIEIQIFRKAGVDMICKIIVDAFKASIAFPSSLLIVLLLLFSNFLFCSFVATVIYGLVNFKYKVTRPVYKVFEMDPFYDEVFQVHPFNEVFEVEQKEAFVNNIPLIITFSVLSAWILIVDNLCMLSVLHGMFTSWCRMTNKSVIPRFIITLRYLAYAYRYNIGSFAYMCLPFVSIIQVIRTICANIHLLEMKIKESPYNIYCFLVVIGHMVSNSSIMCASYGKCFYPSMKGAYKVLLQNCMKFAAARLVITGILFFGLILIPGIMVGVVFIHIAIWNPINYAVYLGVTVFVSSIITSGVLFIFSAAVDSVLFCHLEELLNNKANA